jgi:hypothetical protein
MAPSASTGWIWLASSITNRSKSNTGEHAALIRYIVFGLGEVRYFVAFRLRLAIARARRLSGDEGEDLAFSYQKAKDFGALLIQDFERSSRLGGMRHVEQPISRREVKQFHARAIELFNDREITLKYLDILVFGMNNGIHRNTRPSFRMK